MQVENVGGRLVRGPTGTLNVNSGAYGRFVESRFWKGRRVIKSCREMLVPVRSKRFEVGFGMMNWSWMGGDKRSGGGRTVKTRRRCWERQDAATTLMIHLP